MTIPKPALLLTTVVGLWLGCAVLAYGLVLAQQQRGHPTFAGRWASIDQSIATLSALGGPISLVGIGVTMATGTFEYHGVLFRPLREEEIATLVATEEKTP